MSEDKPVPKTEEMFPDSNPSENKLQQIKRDVLKAELSLKNLHRKRGDLTRSLAIAKHNKDWTRIEDLKCDIADVGRRIKAKEEEICYLQRDLMYSFWPPRGFSYNKQSHLKEVRDRFTPKEDHDQRRES